MTRHTLLELWDGSWDGDIWFTPWAKAIAGLTPDQAAWKPASGRHSIWQGVNHVAFWREVSLAMVRGQPRPAKEQTQRRNFEEPGAGSEAAWEAAKERLAETYRQIRAVIADPGAPLDRVKFHLAHDSYHLGQVMLIRALQGLPPID